MPATKRRKKRTTPTQIVWMEAARLLAGVGIWRILPGARDVCIEWASTRKPTPAVLAQRYLYELVEFFKVESVSASVCGSAGVVIPNEE